VGRIRSAALAAGFLITAIAFSQDKTFRVDVQLVRLLTTVKDASGQLIGGLNKEDFIVTDNGVKQQIAVFEKNTSQPLSIALMVDISGSTAKDLKYEVDSMTRFVHALFKEGNPEDRVSLFSFNWEVRQQSNFTRNSLGLERLMHRLKPEAGTSMYDAIYLAATKELSDREGRRVMVMVTDGGDTISSHTYHDALRALHSSDTVFYAMLVVPIPTDAGRNTGGENALTTLSQGTGGKVFLPSVGAQLDAAFDEVLRDLRTQYLIGYYPKSVPLTKERFHKIDIRTVDPKLRAVSRTGYYGEYIP
jgi:Ca-activated chloride channel family protein